MQENLSKFKTKKEGGDFYHWEIAELERPIKVILKEMLNNIENGEYDIVVGIDASGRVPALVVKKFIDHIYSKKGFGLPNTRFIAGKVNKLNAEEKVKEWNPKKKVLIIEDTINTGDSIKFLCQVLRENGISFDVATVGNMGVYSDTSEIKEELKEKLGVQNIYFGIVGTPSIYDQEGLSGVVKEGEGEAHSRPYKQIAEEEWSSNPNIQKNINQAREDADIVANRLVEWYESDKNEK